MHWFEEILGAADDAVRYVDKTLREPGRSRRNQETSLRIWRR